VTTHDTNARPTIGPEMPRSNKRLHLAAAIVLAGAAIATVPLTTGHHSSAAGHDHVAAAAYDSACGLTGGSNATPTTTPATQWQSVADGFGNDGWSAAITTAYGPGVRTPDGPWSCFARTPTGAAIAAYSIGLRINVAKDFSAVVKKQTATGPGQAALLAKGPSVTPGSPTIPAGFVIDSYTAQAAAVRYYLRQGGLTFTCSVNVQWSGGEKGDWLLELAADGGTSTSCVQGAPNRFVPWGPA
jgi:hypothetical protein